MAEDLLSTPRLAHSLPEHDLFGLRLHALTGPALESLFDACRQGLSAVFFGYSLTVLPRLGELPTLVPLCNTFDVLTADGKGLYLFARLFGIRLAEHISIPDLAERSVEYGGRKGCSLLLFGATPEVNTRAVERLRAAHPGLARVEGVDGWFDRARTAAVLDGIVTQRPDIVLIGISSPLKEEWAADLRSRMQGTIIVPCGGMIDVFAGVTQREPRWVKALSLAWLYRFLQEPRRLFRPLFLNAMQVLLVLLPVCLWNHYVIRNRGFTFQEWYVR